MTSAMEDAHILMSMTYASRANTDVSAKDFNEILQQAQLNNAANPNAAEAPDNPQNHVKTNVSIKDTTAWTKLIFAWTEKASNPANAPIW